MESASINDPKIMLNPKNLWAILFFFFVLKKKKNPIQNFPSLFLFDKQTSGIRNMESRYTSFP